jgi:hypothetical protein
MLVAALSHEPMGEQAGSLIVQSASQKLDFCASPGDSAKKGGPNDGPPRANCHCQSVVEM